MRREDILKQLTTPIGAPAFPRGPFRFTNREYLNEFTRRWRRRPQAALDGRPEIPEELRGSLRLFDGVWYGSNALTPEAVTTYHQSQLEFLNHV